MKISKNKKYRILSLIARYSFIAVVAVLLLAPTVSVQANNHCGGKNQEPCDYVGDLGNQSPATPAGTNNTNNTPAGTNNTNNTPAGTNNTNSIKIDAGIENPLGKGISDIPSFIEAVLRFILYLGIPLVALAIIYTGFLFVTAMGNSEKLKKAKSALVYTLIGAALLLGAFVIAEAIQGTVEEISTGV